MKFIAHIDIMPQKALLDPQGRAVTAAMKQLHLNNIHEVRVGKHLTLEIEANDKNDALASAEEACKKLLANPVMENYVINISA